MSRITPIYKSLSRKLLLTIITLILGAIAARPVFVNLKSQPGTLLANPAWAEDPSEPSVAQPEATSGTETSLEESQAAVFEPNPLDQLALSLKEKERELAEREKALEEKEARFETLRKEVEQDLAQVQEVLGKMEELAGQAELKRKQEIAKWIKIYQSMSSAQAAEVIVKLEPDFALQLLSQMEPKKAAKILEAPGFPSEKAVELVKKLGKLNP